MAENGWYKRKRKHVAEATKLEEEEGSDGASSVVPAVNETKVSLPVVNSNSSTSIPESLLPFLEWTKLSACHLRPAKKRKHTNWNRDEALQKVSGRAIFFIHDPHPNDGESDDKDESKIWFQGRFFPSVGLLATKSRTSPTSVSSDRVAPSSTFSSSSLADNSWGLLATQNDIIDECLTCSEGGYRELDLTFIRTKKQQQQSTMMRMSSFNNKRKKEKKVRWVSQDVIWTGGNMMNLTTDPYSSSTTTTISNTEPGIKFETQKLMEGTKAMDIASKYFPSMVKRLEIHNVTNESSFEEKSSDAMVLIGDMEVVVPVSFAKLGNNTNNVGFARRLGEDSSDDDGLWND